MHRRTFISSLASLAVAGPTAAQMNHDMSTMNHGAQSNEPTTSLLDLPEGQPLRELPRLANQSATPGLFKASITAGPMNARLIEGIDTPMLGYNGGNPVIEVTEGDRVELDFTNDIPDEPTTIHWHGMPVPADQDGNPMDAVAPGGGRSYVFDLPSGSAAPYWFHPHPHEFTAEQVYRGLAGVFLVKPKADPIPAAYGDTVLLLTDIRLAADGTVTPNTPVDLMNGRIGDHVLTNGQRNPKIEVRAGERRRFRLINATNARFLCLAFENARMTVIGTDGGLLESPVAADEILLTPGERVEIVAAFDSPGPATLTTLEYDRGWMGPGKPDESRLALLTTSIAGDLAEPMPNLPRELRTIPALTNPAVTRRFVLSEEMGGGMEGVDHSSMPAAGMKFLINGASFDMNRIDTVSKVGQVELWEIVNDADMDHPFHIHGTQFQVIERELGGVVSQAPYPAWKDTVNVVPGETVRVLLRQELPGTRMYHCHILEHEKLGMMGIVDVQA
ncbi:multicopper oxidase family protein [Paradevosia shaoguanensis]|uniref:Multicopper oxidase family protein n=1 Tax=Paradevosia shaoguanensis TaxID=1335043 RepID=A0AA41QLU6_9HYPH|nr:multicopper oxidase family protein [Paradevosia shaoguanensis]MCF1742769.1 multicopper oxidase family protein [Paradevosia shaoguanensis]MCI0127252.1 multicopper oxidase family protein [Paradevosia shaoguanensis]